MREVRLIESFQGTLPMPNICLVDIGVVDLSICISAYSIQAMEGMLAVDLCKMCIVAETWLSC